MTHDGRRPEASVRLWKAKAFDPNKSKYPLVTCLAAGETTASLIPGRNGESFHYHHPSPHHHRRPHPAATMLSSTLRSNLTRCTRRLSSRRLASTSAESSAKPSLKSSFKTAAFTTSVAISAYTIGSLYPPELATYITPRIAPPPPDPDHPSAIAYTEDLENRLQNLPALAALRSKPDASEWYETRPYMAVPKEQLANSLTGGALRGPGKLTLPPLVRARKDESEAVVITHLGTALCGHEGIVHGGLLATMLDESLGRIVSCSNLVPDCVLSYHST